ncbi:MAG: ABC transporter ATP-binding protein [Candidatus Izemoplasma sp.]
MSEKILEVKDLQTSFYTHLGEVQAVRGISFDVNQGDVLGIVGESGSGKSVTSLSIMNLIEQPGKIKNGTIMFDGVDLVKLTNKEMSEYRGNDIAMIFQDPMTSLNPVYTIKNQIMEVIRRHTNMNKHEAFERAKELLKMVGIPDPDIQIHDYPFQFSGGMRQRALIAAAISCSPKLLIADEPTTALDVTIQAQILELLKDLQKETGMSIILITHDLGVIAEISTHVIVMYGGMIMEKGLVGEIFYNAQHPYTKGLHKSIPKTTGKNAERLVPIEGSPPDLMSPPPGCPFSPRCDHAMKICLKEAAPLFKISETQTSSCWLHSEEAPTVEGFSKAKESE